MSPKPTIFNPFITLVRYPALHPRLHIRLIANVGSGGGGAPVSAAAPAAGGAPAVAAAPVVEEKRESTWTRRESGACRQPASSRRDGVSRRCRGERVRGVAARRGELVREMSLWTRPC